MTAKTRYYLTGVVAISLAAGCGVSAAITGPSATSARVLGGVVAAAALVAAFCLLHILHILVRVEASEPAPKRRKAKSAESAQSASLWELEDVYSILTIQMRSHRERIEEARGEGRRAFEGGQVADRELALLENTYDDLRFMRQQLAIGYCQVGGSYGKLREIDDRIEEIRGRHVAA